ncbi:MAG TPA: metallophosphoesterase [Thermoanaerobaculaceae bacterium]|nr:metallophosphoesterase [Thermoanaerobaculaceae bacterium]
MKTVTYLTRRNILKKGAMAFVGGGILARSGWAEATDLPMVRRVTLTHPLLPHAFDGLRIAQVADVHAGMFMPPERLVRVRALVETLVPDLVVFTGDQLDRRQVDADFFVHGFAGIDAPLGAFGILGNHDHLAGPRLALAALEAVGVTPLVNQSAALERNGSRVLLIGVDDLDATPGWGPDFTAANHGEAGFRILLCHQPNGWRAGRAAGANVTLSGHTHGGQIAVPSRGVNLARLSTPYIAGAYQKAGQLLYVSRGIGVGAVPLRFGVPPEVDLITLRRGPLSEA